MSLTITYTNESSEVKSQNSQGNISLILGYNGRPYDLHVINDNNLRIRIGNQEGYINDINIDTNTLDDDEKYRGAFTIPLSNSVIQQLPPGVYYLEVWINVSDQNNQTQQMIFPSDDTLPFTLTPNIVNDSNSLPMITFDRVRQAWEDFKNFIMGHQAQIEDDLATFDGVTDSFVGKVDDGISGYNNFVSQAGNKLNSLADSGKANIAAGVASADSNVSDINYRVDSAKTQISTAANGVYSVVDSDVNSAESAINSATASNKSETTSTVNSAENIINNAANGVVNGVNVTVDSAMTRIDNAADGIRGQVEGIVSSGDNRINNTAAGIESITSSAVSNASYVSTSLNSVANSAVTNVNYTVNSADNNMSNFASDINNRTSSADQHIDNDVSDAESNVDSTVASADSNMSNFASDINDRTSSADNHIDSDVTSADGHIDNDVASGDAHIDNTVSNADSHVDSNVLSGETRISNDVTTGESNINSVASAANTNTTNIAQNNTDTINSTATSAVSHVDSDVQSTDDHMNSLFNIDDAKTASAVSHIDSDATSVTNMAQTYSNNINSQANSAYTSINASGVNVYNGINNSGVSAYNAEDYSARSAYSNINNSASSAYINIDGYNGSASNAISGNTSSGISAINSAYGIASSAIQYAVDHSDKLIESDITNGVKSSVSNDFNKQAVSVQAQVEKTSNDVATINNNVTSLSNSTGSMAINVANQANEYTDEKANSVLSAANHQTDNQAYDIQDQLNSVSDVTSNVATSAINRDNDLQNQINNHPNWNDENWTRNTVVPNAANSAKADANAHADQVATSAINQANANMEANRSSLSSRDDNMQAQISQNKNDILNSTRIKDVNEALQTGKYTIQGVNSGKHLPDGVDGGCELTLFVFKTDEWNKYQVLKDMDHIFYRYVSFGDGTFVKPWHRVNNEVDFNNLQNQISNNNTAHANKETDIKNDLQNQINSIKDTVLRHKNIVDVNTATTTGNYSIDNKETGKNLPSGVADSVELNLFVFYADDWNKYQVLKDTQNIFYRYMSHDNFSKWYKIINDDDLNSLRNSLPSWGDENWTRGEIYRVGTNTLNQANAHTDSRINDITKYIGIDDPNNATSTGRYTIMGDGKGHLPSGVSSGIEMTLIVYNPDPWNYHQLLIDGAHIFYRYTGADQKWLPWTTFSNSNDYNNLQNQISGNNTAHGNAETSLQNQVNSLHSAIYDHKYITDTNITNTGTYSLGKDKCQHVPNDLIDNVECTMFVYSTDTWNHYQILIDTSHIFFRYVSFGDGAFNYPWIQLGNQQDLQNKINGLIKTASNENDARNISNSNPGSLVVYSD